DGSGNVLRRRHDPTDGHRGAEDLLARMISIGRDLTSDLPDGRSLTAIGIAFTGVIDPEEGTVLQLNGKIPDIAGVEVGSRIGRAFDTPCWVDNDTRVYTIGE